MRNILKYYELKITLVTIINRTYRKSKSALAKVLNQKRLNHRDLSDIIMNPSLVIMSMILSYVHIKLLKGIKF